MNSLRSTYEAWRSRRELKFIAWWGRKRAKGEVRFVLWFVSFYTIMVVGGTSLAGYYFDGSIRLREVVVKVVAYILGGSLFGLFVWWDNERRYERLLKRSLGDPQSKARA